MGETQSQLVGEDMWAVHPTTWNTEDMAVRGREDYVAIRMFKVKTNGKVLMRMQRPCSSTHCF